MPAARSVNFLRARRQNVEKFQQLDNRIFQGSLVVCVLFVVLTIGLAVYLSLQQSELERAKTQERSQQAIINREARTEAEYLLYSSRLDILKDVFLQRGTQKVALEFIGLLSSSDISFDRIAYDDQTRELSFRVQAQNVFAVDSFLERLRSAEIRPLFEELTLGSVRRDEEKMYSLDIVVVLGGAQDQEGEQRGRI